MKVLTIGDPLPTSNAYADILVEQLLNASIVAGVAAVASWTGMTPDFLVMGKAFALTFLIELRKYRVLGDRSTPTPAPPGAPA